VTGNALAVARSEKKEPEIHSTSGEEGTGMQNQAETRKLLKQVNEELTSLQQLADEITKLQLTALNTSKQFLVGAQSSVTQIRIAALKQKLSKLADLYLDQWAKAQDALETLDGIES
jgi:flagellar hook-basal body complex protein FliE